MVAVLLSFLMPNVHFMLKVSGSLSGTFVTIILPAVMYNAAYASRTKMKAVNYVMILIGVMIGVVGIVDSFTTYGTDKAIDLSKIELKQLI